MSDVFTRVDVEDTVGLTITKAYENGGDDVIFVFGATRSYCRIDVDKGYYGDDANLEDGDAVTVQEVLHDSGLRALGLIPESLIQKEEARRAQQAEAQKLANENLQRQEYLRLKKLYEEGKI